MNHQSDHALGDYAALLPKNNVDDISTIIDKVATDNDDKTMEELRQNEEKQKNIIKRIQDIVATEESKIAEQDPEISVAVKRLSKTLKVSIEDAPTSPLLLSPEPPIMHVNRKLKHDSEASRISALIDPAATEDEAAELLDELESLREKQNASARWDSARSTVKTKARLVSEATLVVPAVFFLVDFVTATLGVVAVLLILFSFCMTDTALFYTILLNMMACGLELIPIAQFSQMAAKKETSVTFAFHMFPRVTIHWKFLLVFVVLEFVAMLIRLVSITLAWRYRTAVLIIKEYIECRLPAAPSPESSSSVDDDYDIFDADSSQESLISNSRK